MPSSTLGVVSVFAPVELPLTFLRLFVLCWGLDSTSLILLGHFGHMMRICAGLVGQKSGSIENVLVFKSFLKGSRGARGPQENEVSSGPERFWFTLGLLCGPRGETFRTWGLFGVTSNI